MCSRAFSLCAVFQSLSRSHGSQVESISASKSAHAAERSHPYGKAVLATSSPPVVQGSGVVVIVVGTGAFPHSGLLFNCVTGEGKGPKT